MQIFTYTVTYFCEDEDKDLTEDGIVIAENTSAAAARLVHYYGEDTLITLSLTYLTNEDVLNLPAPDVSAFAAAVKEAYGG